MNVLSQPEKFCVMSVYARERLSGCPAHASAMLAWKFVRRHFLKRSRALWWDIATEHVRDNRTVARVRFCPLGEALGVERMQGRAQHAKDTLTYLERHYAPFRDLVQRF